MQAQAMEKMKEINAAYDTLTGKNLNAGFDAGQSHAQNESYAGVEGESLLRARAFIQSGDWRSAEAILLQLQNRSAEWHFLMGMVLWRSGRYDSAKVHLNQAASMDPGNAEYRSACDQFMRQGSGFAGRTTAGTAQQQKMCQMMQCLLLTSCCAGGSRCPLWMVWCC